MHNVHARIEHMYILLNNLDQLVCPTENVMTELSSFFGTLRRNEALCPFDTLDLRRMDTKKGFVKLFKFRELLKYWKFEKFKKMSVTNSKNREKLMNPHTTRKKSFTLIGRKIKGICIHYGPLCGYKNKKTWSFVQGIE
uniref:Uncharacterized protein n=1 Tax=Solanum lycopersicum TaxID=4081 RepID=A0A3Q7HKC5_SOLLC